MPLRRWLTAGCAHFSLPRHTHALDGQAPNHCRKRLRRVSTPALLTTSVDDDDLIARRYARIARALRLAVATRALRVALEANVMIQRVPRERAGMTLAGRGML